LPRQAIDARVVGDDRQVLDVAFLERIDQRLGNAAQAEAADGEHLVVGDDAGQRLLGGGIDLVHHGS